MQQPASIFNDVIGPVMIGPSSSHTAASVRIGQVIRSMMRGQARKVVFQFSTQGSLATTYIGQGSAFGLAAGILGLAPDNARVADALTMAKSAGVEIEFQLIDEPCDHPNVYKVTMWDNDDQCISAEMVSVGGGMIEVRKIENIPVLLGGGYYETIFLLGNLPETEAGEIHTDGSALMASSGLSYDEISLHHNEQGDYLINIKSTVPIGEKAGSLIPVGKRLDIDPVLPILSQKDYRGLFNTAEEMLAIAKAEHLHPWELAVKYESLRGGISPEEVLEKMTHIVRVIKRTMDLSEAEQNEYQDRILGRQAYKLDAAKLLEGAVMNEVVKRITLMMEGKSSMKVIVAAPTAGSCGVVSGTLFGVAKVMRLEEDALVKGMMTAGLIGTIIAEHATFAGEVGGCQAECGSASGMAAAGVVQLMGGTVEQALDAASMALQNVLGMVCDPVADRVEVPCLGKNIMCGCNALAMANLAMAGFDKVVPLDETIRAMAQVGNMIPVELRCTGKAGLSVLKTSTEIWHKLND
ncbi:MAG: L-serine ammonia-lyase, iron-sulfur-dependent, subunit alpha [Dehalobacterium sp.]